MPNPEQDEIVRVLEEAHKQAIEWIENRSQVPVAPAAISVPEMSLLRHGSAPEGAEHPSLNGRGVA